MTLIDLAKVENDYRALKMKHAQLSRVIEEAQREILEIDRALARVEKLANRVESGNGQKP